MTLLSRAVSPHCVSAITIAALALGCVNRPNATVPNEMMPALLQPCATRVIVRNSTARAHVLSWVDPSSGAPDSARIPARPNDLSEYVSVVVRVPPEVRLSLNGAVTASARASNPCVTPLPQHAPDSLPADYGTHNALTSGDPGARFPGIVILSFERGTSRAWRDSVVLSRKLELVGGSRVGNDGLGIWAFWIPDDRTAAHARALASDLARIPGVRSASLTGLSSALP